MKNCKKWSVGVALLTGFAIMLNGCSGTSAPSNTNTQAPTKAVSVDQSADKKIQSATVERLERSKLKISWGADEGLGEVRIFWSNSPENIEQQGKLLTSVPSDSSVTIDDPSPGKRPYFRITPTEGLAITVAERLVPLEGADNFRDLGGYATEDGRTVKWGHLYRSDALHKLTDVDTKYLQDSGLKLVCDYRSGFEVEHKPNRSIAGTQYDNMPVFKDSEIPAELDTRPMFESGDLSPLGKPGDYMLLLNRSYVTINSAFVRLLELAQNPDNLPLVQHCSAGKDRTGFGSAMLLLALGVPEKTVMDDFMLSKEYTKEASQKTVESLKPKLKDQNSVDILVSIYDVREEYLQAALDEIKQKYGTINQYLEKELDLTQEKREKLRNLLLE